ncbi:hypothetical protein J8273_7263 [Carpediemonas membranifera]|uniref:Uncharacterized protein n=1 Tax=Carpediemonas membranifera TaxID=201153 RepID=A0A8J6B1L7_9EUKA|nr:hypothetical protein J8273_7263 [Carpediemonas membranifera]|eukprot:KAG9390989.1 hypothetical protein J8273_7263 [Carpediemonas membranifera]
MFHSRQCDDVGDGNVEDRRRARRRALEVAGMPSSSVIPLSLMTLDADSLSSGVGARKLGPNVAGEHYRRHSSALLPSVSMANARQVDGGLVRFSASERIISPLTESPKTRAPSIGSTSPSRSILKPASSFDSASIHERVTSDEAMSSASLDESVSARTLSMDGPKPTIKRRRRTPLASLRRLVAYLIDLLVL